MPMCHKCYKVNRASNLSQLDFWPIEEENEEKAFFFYIGTVNLDSESRWLLLHSVLFPCRSAMKFQMRLSWMGKLEVETWETLQAL